MCRNLIFKITYVIETELNEYLPKITSLDNYDHRLKRNMFLHEIVTFIVGYAQIHISDISKLSILFDTEKKKIVYLVFFFLQVNFDNI